MAWTMPRKALPKAMPAMVPALCVLSRACALPARSVTAASMLSKIRRIACSARPSVKSLAYTDAYASMAWVRASKPLSVSSGSTMATLGVRA